MYILIFKLPEAVKKYVKYFTSANGTKAARNRKIRRGRLTREAEYFIHPEEGNREGHKRQRKETDT